MTIATLFRKCNNLNAATRCVVNCIWEDEHLHNDTVFDGTFMNMPLGVYEKEFTNFTIVDSKNMIVVNV